MKARPTRARIVATLSRQFGWAAAQAQDSPDTDWRIDRATASGSGVMPWPQRSAAIRP